jgi:hypothetical protein
MSTPPRITRCPHCGSQDIVADVVVTQTADAGRIGLSYRTHFLLTGTAALRTELCRQCGSVVRLYVKETGKNWQTG